MIIQGLNGVITKPTRYNETGNALIDFPNSARTASQACPVLLGASVCCPAGHAVVCLEVIHAWSVTERLCS